MLGKYVFQSGCRNVDADEGELYKRDYRNSTYYLKYTDGVWLLCKEQSTYRRDHNDMFRLSSKGKNCDNDLFSCFVLTIAISNSLEKNPLLLDTQWERNDSRNESEINVWSGEVTVKIFNNEEEYNQYRNAN